MARRTHLATVDVVIPVHTSRRPLGRAIDSVLAGNTDGVRVVVVAHGITSQHLRAHLAGRNPEQVRVIEYSDGIKSIAGPVNAAIDSSDADYILRLDSDDVLEPGAVAAWRDQAERSQADVVLARLRLPGRRYRDFPHVRPGRVHRLDPVADRLFTRSVPFGLIRRSTLVKLEARAAPGLRPAEDQPMTAKLLAMASRIELAHPRSPAHAMFDDQEDRIQKTSHGAEQIVAGAGLILASSWFAELPSERQSALAIAIMRRVIVPTLSSPLATWDAQQVRNVSELVDMACAVTPRLPRVLSIPQQEMLAQLLDAKRRGSSAPNGGARKIGRLRSLRTGNVIVTLFDRESPLRHAIAEYVGNRSLGRVLAL